MFQLLTCSLFWFYVFERVTIWLGPIALRGWDDLLSLFGPREPVGGLQQPDVIDLSSENGEDIEKEDIQDAEVLTEPLSMEPRNGIRTEQPIRPLQTLCLPSNISHSSAIAWFKTPSSQGGTRTTKINWSGDQAKTIQFNQRRKPIHSFVRTSFLLSR